MLIIFDLDDTLIDTQASIVPRKLYLVLEALWRRGFINSLDKSKDYLELLALDQTSPSSLKSIEIFLHNKNAPSECAALAEKILKTPLSPHFQILARESALEILKNLHRHHHLALVSHGEKKLQMQKLRKAGIDYRLFHIIQVILTGDKRGCYEEIFKKFPMHSIQNVVVVGDRITKDLIPAKQLGFTTVHMCYGRGRKSEKENVHVDCEVDTLMEFYNWIQSRGNL